MRSLWAFLLPSICSIAAATSKPAQVLLFSPGAKPSANSRQVVDPNTARLIFAHRLGLSQFEILEDVSEKVVEQLNTFGGSSQHLFGEQQQSTVEHGFIIVEGVQEPTDFIPNSLQSYLAFDVVDPPSSASHLWQDFVNRASQVSKQASSPWRHTYNAEQIAELFSAFFDGEEHLSSKETLGPITFLSISDLTTLRNKYGSKSNLYQDANTRLQQAFDNLIELAQHENFSLTILLMPASPPKNSRRSENSWGSSEFLRSAEDQSQAPQLSQQQSTASRTGPASVASSTYVPTALADDSPLKGPIPTCFASLASCQSGTRNCSGHGECGVKYTYDKTTCFGCFCNKPEVRKNADGSRKTTQFGGPACSKKDVSVPFWLFATFTIIMVGLLSYGIGLLYSMGSEELPSVIGAGVSGPRPK